jgi:hypothetical protein
VERPLGGGWRAISGSHISRRHFDGRNWSADGSPVPEISGIKLAQRLEPTFPERGPPGRRKSTLLTSPAPRSLRNSHTLREARGNDTPNGAYAEAKIWSGRNRLCGVVPL